MFYTRLWKGTMMIMFMGRGHRWGGTMMLFTGAMGDISGQP